MTGGDNIYTVGSFGKKLKQLRTKAGLTQEELADKCGIKKQSISRYEKSVREPNIRTAKKIAEALDVPLELLAPTSFDLQFFAEKPAQGSKYAEFIEQLDQLPPETLELVLAQLRATVQAQKARDGQ